MGVGVTDEIEYSIYHSHPSGTVKVQRAHIPLSQPLGTDRTKEVVQSSSEVTKSLISPL